MYIKYLHVYNMMPDLMQIIRKHWIPWICSCEPQMVVNHHVGAGN